MGSIEAASVGIESTRPQLKTKSHACVKERQHHLTSMMASSSFIESIASVAFQCLGKCLCARLADRVAPELHLGDCLAALKDLQQGDAQ